ncbi:MAG: hypothetical protein AAF449_07095, partial [Myxococcota bacterium]
EKNQTPTLESVLDPVARASVNENLKGSDALQSLVRFIPTETITLYIAAVAAVPLVNDMPDPVVSKIVLWSFAALTPIIFVLLLFGKRASSGLPTVPAFSDWPWFKLFASTVAFVAWAVALPESPYLLGEQRAVGAFVALFVSTMLSLLEPVLSRPSAPPAPE